MHLKRFLFLLLIMLLAACGQDEPPPAATAVPPSATPAAAAQAATATPTPTPAPAFTATLPPPPTLAPATATPTPAATATPTVTPTPAPVTLLTLEDFGDNRNPLTGELVDDPTVLQRRPIAIKLSNSPPEYTRPQAGLSQADLVFEHVTEGPITRFTAVFYGQSPPDVGPIRSARLIDVEIPAMYDAALAFSGASSGADGVYNRLAASDIRGRLIRDIAGEPGYYRTDEEDKPWEHRLHAHPDELWERLTAMEQNEAPTFNANMAFTSQPPDGGEAAAGVIVQYQSFAEVSWAYDEANGRYWRSIDGEPHVDANTGEQLSAANVVLLYAIHVQVVSICENLQNGVCTANSAEIQLWGQGDVTILRDGQQYDGVWVRNNRGDMLTFYDDAGNVIPLQVGNTWFQVVPYHYRNPVKLVP